jgi:hypothetical protein
MPSAVLFFVALNAPVNTPMKAKSVLNACAPSSKPRRSLWGRGEVSSPGLQTLQEKIRDARIMARQGKGFDYIRAVFGWSAETMREICATYGIIVTDQQMAAPQRARAYRPREANKRLSQIRFSTADRMMGLLLTEARERNTSVSAIVDLIVTNAHKQGIWPELLDSNPVPVASASHHNRNNERQ